MARVFTIAEGLENMGALKTGGQGSIYKTRRTRDGIITAIKLLPTPIYSESPTDKAFRDFQNEVQKLKKVNEMPNPHVVKILSSGITESGSLPFIEMEFIEGPDLEELLKPPYDPVFTIKETIRVAEQLSNALAHCHKVNVKHGDIKSNNVKFNEKTGNYVLLDFGMAIMSDEQRRTSLRQAGAIEFMAPEQNEGMMLFETDVYSFGIILYELLAGTVPFPLRNKSETARNRVMVDHMETPPPELLSLRRQHLPDTMSQDELKVPQWLIDTIYRCLEKSPGSRFRNGLELHMHIRSHNTATGHPKDWGAEQLTLLQQQNEKLTKQNEELQRYNKQLQDELEKLAEEKEAFEYEAKKLRHPVAGAAAWQPQQEVYEPQQPVKRSRNWTGTILLIVFLACAVGAAFVYAWKTSSPGNKEQDKAAANQPDKLAQVVGQYKVVVPRAYFHNEPDENTRREAYMIPSNDVVTATKESNDFVYTEFTNTRGQTSRGWIRKQDLVTLEDWAKRDSGTKFDPLPAQEDINTQLKQARELVSNNELPEALYIYSYLSKQGVPEAMYYYGNLALQNKNDDIECPEAMQLLTRASNKGYTPAKRTLGFLYIFAENRDILQMNDYERCQFDRDVFKGTKLLVEAVAAGDSTAQRMLDEVRKWTEEAPVDPNL
jgi:eukaryotic-like serine/threonine-protein kinase